jgi:pimeloyl-ACP methyl ester carboxylesterase
MWFLILVLAMVPGGAQTTRIQTAHGETLNLVIAGEGDPVVLLPGYCGSAFAFREVIPLLAQRGNRTIVIEPLGIGHSSRPRKADYSLTGQADRIAVALDSLRIQGAILVAHGEASSMALRIACRRPDLVRGVVLLEGGAAEAAGTPGLRRTMKLAPVIKLLGPSLMRREMGKRMKEVSGDSSWITEAVISGYLSGIEADFGAAVDAIRTVANAEEPEPLAPRLSEIRCPVELLLGGAPHPGGVPAEELALFRAHLDRVRILTIPGAGHFIHEENPACVGLAVERIKRSTPADAGSDDGTLASSRPSGPEGR